MNPGPREGRAPVKKELPAAALFLRSVGRGRSAGRTPRRRASPAAEECGEGDGARPMRAEERPKRPRYGSAGSRAIWRFSSSSSREATGVNTWYFFQMKYMGEASGGSSGRTHSTLSAPVSTRFWNPMV